MNATAANEQYAESVHGEHAVAALKNGGFVVTWTSDVGGTNLNDVFAQRFDADGDAVGSQFRVNTFTDKQQMNASVTTLSNGNFIVTWSSYGQTNDEPNSFGIYAQRYTESGATIGSAFRLNTTTLDSQDHANIAATGDGGFIVTFMSQVRPDYSFDVRARRFDSNGNAVDTPTGGTQILTDFVVGSSSTGDQGSPVVTTLNDGNYLMTWSQLGRDGDGWGVYGQIYNASGVALNSADFRINTETSDDQHYQSAAKLDNGSFVVTWSSFGQDGSGYGIYAQRFSSAGAKLGDEARVAVTTANNQIYSDVIGLDDGGYMVAWASAGDDPPSLGTGIYAQRYTAGGVKVGGQQQINETTEFSQKQPHLVELSGGDVVVIWSGNGAGDSDGIFGRFVDIA